MTHRSTWVPAWLLVLHAGCFESAVVVDAQTESEGQTTSATGTSSPETPTSTTAMTTGGPMTATSLGISDSATTDTGDAPSGCRSNAECGGTPCVDGFCCDSPCAGGCEACDVPGREGTCAPIERGEDPKGVCPAGVGAAEACIPGGCDGAGDCFLSPTTTECRVGSCEAGVAIDPSYCTEDGRCPPSTTTTCAPLECAGDACAVVCEGHEDCQTGTFCVLASRTCEPQRPAGAPCSETVECENALTCLDGVCCTASECPACQNCGSQGSCDIAIANGPDATGATCEDGRVCDTFGACKADLGEACNAADACASGYCVDGVCCDTGACPECLNCGADGQCSVEVVNTDDLSGLCAYDRTCNDASQCVVRWDAIGQTVVVGGFHPEFAGSVGDRLYFASNSNGIVAQYFRSFDTGTGSFADEPLTNNEFCACGYSGMAVSGPDALYYAGNGAVSFTPGDAEWSALPGYANTVPDGENVAMILGSRLYRVGGRNYAGRVSYFDFGAATWTVDGLTALSHDASQWCGGAANGRLYVFGGSEPMSEYTVASDRWTTLPDDAHAPVCYNINLHQWGEALVYAANSGDEVGVARFNLGTLRWEAEPIPFPQEGLTYRALVARDTLYLLGYNQDGGTVTVFEYLRG